MVLTTNDILELWRYAYPLVCTNMALNMLYPLRTWWPFFARLDLPIDGGVLLWDGRPIFGRSTTVPGLALVIMLGAVYTLLIGTRLGLIEALLTYLGHAAGSFIKRRAAVPDGKFVPLVDHGDYVILSGIVLFATHLAPLWVVTATIILTLAIQPLVTYCGFKLGIRKYPL